MSLRARLGLVILALLVLAAIAWTTLIIVGASEGAKTAIECEERTGSITCE